MMRKVLRSVLFSALAAMSYAVPAYSQATAVRPAPQCRQPFNLTAAGNAEFNNKPALVGGTFDAGGCDTWIVVYNSTGFSAASFQVEGADDLAGVSSTYAVWVTAGGTMITGSFPLTATTHAEATMTGYFPWVRARLVSKTGTGSVSGVLYGWVSNPAQTVSISVSGVSVGDVTNAGVFAVQATLAAETTKVIGTINVALGQTIAISAGSAVIGHVINDASTAVIGHVITDSGSVTASTLSAETTKVIGTINVAAGQTIAVTSAVIGATTDAKSTATDGTAASMIAILKQISRSVQDASSGSNAAASATGSAVPASGSYNALNVGGTLRGNTGTNTSGSIYAADVNIAAAPSITYNSTQPTVTDGQTTADVQITNRGELKVAPGVSGFAVTATLGAETTKVIGTINVAASQTIAVTNAGTFAVQASLVPLATTGWTSLNATAADGATACTSSPQPIKASQGAFGGYFINNPNTADMWLHVYNVASGSVTVGTTNPALSFRIPGTASTSVAANLEITMGIQFSTAMSMACTTTAGGNGNPTNALEADIWFK